MAVSSNYVTIKGNKDGLLFLLDDQCEYSDLIHELRHKLEKTHQNILRGPLIHVYVKLGTRQVSDEQKEEIHQLIRMHGNLLVQSIASESLDGKQKAENHLSIQKGIVRSGQTITIEGSLLFIGDVNPGGTLACTGDVYVLGALKGAAHAGMEGNEQCVIAASYMRPTQLRIADVISRPPDEWLGDSDVWMEFAYLDQGKMEIDKLVQLHRIRPGALDFKGE